MHKHVQVPPEPQLWRARWAGFTHHPGRLLAIHSMALLPQLYRYTRAAVGTAAGLVGSDRQHMENQFGE
jgi:hypothetical protein